MMSEGELQVIAPLNFGAFCFLDIQFSTTKYKIFAHKSIQTLLPNGFNCIIKNKKSATLQFNQDF